jgi:hypothetical protein
MNSSLLLTTVFLLAISIGGCAPREELVAKSGAAPAGMDLSGRWQLRLADLDTMKRIEDAGVAAAGGLEKVVPLKKDASGQTRKSENPGALVYVFLETGVRLKITQTVSGLFISFDRSIVEEYRFGEKRVISVGPVAADRVSGWEEGAYVIVTLDEDGAKMTETYSLSADRQALVRSIRIIHGDEQQLSLEQIFDRDQE